MTARPAAPAAIATPATALRTLLAGIVDYAGLFPPAALGMPDAVARYARYRAEPEAWALGRFVVPVSRLAEFAREAAPHLPSEAGAAPWRLSALAGADIVADAAAIAAFNTGHAAAGQGLAVVDVVELKAAAPDEIAAAVRALRESLGDAVTPYVEIPIAGDPAPLVAAIAAAGARAKVRTGGVTADAFPPAAHLARFVAACGAAGVPFKATAGLHHPLRAEYRLTYAPDAPRGTMYGFLNVFLGAALLRAGMPASELPALLEERDPRAIAIDDDAIAWRGWRATREALAAVREETAIAFGSCSFEEPVGDLREMGFL